MRLVVAVDGTNHNVELAHSAKSATLSDIIAAASGRDLGKYSTVWVDERRYQTGTNLADILLLEGSVITTHRPERRDEQQAQWTATVSAGWEVGQSVQIPAGAKIQVGRSARCELAIDSHRVSRTHFTLQAAEEGLRICDAGSKNGTLVNGKPINADGIVVTEGAWIVAGGAVVTIRKGVGEPPAPKAGSLNNVSQAGTAPFNRPPRQGWPPAPSALIPPTKKDVPQPSKFSFFTLLGPIVLAAAMVVVMKDMRYAMISALSPVLGVGTWYEQKRRHKRDVKAEEKKFKEALDKFSSEIDKAGDVERRRLQDRVPDPATVLHRAELPSTRLWQRRFGAADFLALNAGTGDVLWKPRVDTQNSGRLDDEVKDRYEKYKIPAAPIEVDLSGAGVVGIVGDRAGALAVARSLLVQAAVHVGPADLTIINCCDAGREAEWEWTTWLPHTRRLGNSSGDRWLSANRQRSEELLRGLKEIIDHHPTPALMLVLDSDVLTEGRDAPARNLLGYGRPQGGFSDRDPKTQVSGIVVAAAEEQLPAACTVIIRVKQDADGEVEVPGEVRKIDNVVLAGMDTKTALAGARNMSRLDDPELIIPGSGIPSLAKLNPLLDLDAVPTADEIARLWAASRRFDTPIGVGEDGVYRLDLVRDGPHGLVGGTTGSGKSEFLRSLVAGLAARIPPTKLTFILIDFKGGAAFKTCERLPHTIGTVSNLDEQLARRAIEALEAEMDYRQRLFATVGADNLDAYLATNPVQPMPRLLLVVDEFAMLAKDQPDVLSSLVSVGAVGRTLGVHMILATQRPAGVVNDDILANTNLRVALRVQSREDSVNVIGVPQASAIGREQKGRAYVKLGQDDITPVQTALSTGRSELGTQASVEVYPCEFGKPINRKPATASVYNPKTDLDLLIDAIVQANQKAGFPRPRPVWPAPLGSRVSLAGFHNQYSAALTGQQTPLAGGIQDTSVLFALADDPTRQRQFGVGWDMARGNLLLAGIPGSGTSTTLASIALICSLSFAPDNLDIVILDMGSRDLASLAGLPHCVGYVGAGQGAREQQVRLLKYLRAEVDRRKPRPGQHRPLVVLIDGLATLRDEYQDFDGLALLDGLYRAYADGPELSVFFAVTTTRAKAVPSAIDEVTTQRWLFRLADAYDYTSAGLRPTDAPSQVPGRCVLTECKLQAHVATPNCSLEDAVKQVVVRWGRPASKPTVVGQLPEQVAVDAVGAAQISSEPWIIPVGIKESDLGIATLECYENEHILVAGPARSGKSTTLLALAQAIRNSTSNIQIWALCGRRSPLVGADLDRVVTDIEDLASMIASLRMSSTPVLLLIDDAEKFDDSDQSLNNLILENLSHLRIIAAGRSDDLRNLYSHWTRTIRKSRCGILLVPNVDLDGELLAAMIPRKAPVAMTPGRGYTCVAGAVELVQFCSPSSQVPGSAPSR